MIELHSDSRYSLENFIEEELSRLNRFRDWYKGNQECDLNGEYPDSKNYWAEWLEVYNGFE